MSRPAELLKVAFSNWDLLKVAFSRGGGALKGAFAYLDALKAPFRGLGGAQ